MVRKISAGNGRMLIASDRGYRIGNIYYPTVGQENHLGGHPACRKRRQGVTP